MKKNILTLFAVIIGLTANIGLLHAETDNWSTHAEEVTPSGDTYTITSAGQLAWIASQVNGESGNSFEGKTIILNNDIDLAAHEWTPIGNSFEKGFKGTFDGNGKTISNMKISITSNNEQEKVIGGLFGYILNDAVVKNVTIAGTSSIELSGNKEAFAGGIVALAQGITQENKKAAFAGTIENCHSAASISVSISPTTANAKGSENSAVAGGIAGEVYAGGKKSSDPDYPGVINCSSSGNMTSTCTTTQTTNGVLSGGILGRAESVKVQNCYSTGNMTSTGGQTPYTGGIVGHVSYEVQILDCYSTGTITSSSNRTEEAWGIAGGISGTISQNSVVKNCYATGDISVSLPNTTNAGSEVWAGGIVGYGINKAGSKIENCAALNGTISVSGNKSFSKKAVHRIFGKNEGQTTLSGNYAYVGIELSIDSQSTIVTAEGIDKEDGTILVSFDLPTLFDSNKGWTLSETTLPTLTDCGTAVQTGKPQSDYFIPASELKTLLSRESVTAISLKDGVTYDFSDESLNINKAVTITSNVYNKAIIKGNICIEAEDVALNNLKIETVSTGTKYWQKNAVSVIGKKVTITTCDFVGSIQAGHAEEWVVNGIVLFPTATAPEYKLTGNTFTMFKGTTSDKKWTATAIIMADGYTLDKKENGQVVLPAVSNFNETAIASANTYTDCFADYIHMTNSKYVYSHTQSADGVADAWLSMDKGTIDASAVTNEAVLTALNATEKPTLTGKAIAIKCSDAWLVTNESLAGNDLPVLVITKAEGGDYKAVKKTYAPTIDNSKLTASTIEAGQTLSASVLSGGKATADGKEIAGTFAWEDPKTVAAEGEQTYSVVFTPNDLSGYSPAKTSYTFSGKNAIKQYYTVTTGKCENGSVEIKEANAANRYLKGSTLTLVYHPDVNYKTKAGAETTLNVTEDKVVTTTFEAIMHTVTIAAGANGSVSVNGTAYTGSSNTISVPQGSELAVQVIPATDYIGSLTCSDSKVISNGVVTVDKPFTITGSFTEKPADEFVVSVPAVQNGKILLYDKDGNAINAGTSVETGTVISVLAVPDLGYKLTSDGIKNNGTSISGGKITVTAAASITAAFEKQTFVVSTEENTNATITISGTGSDSLDKVPYGTTLTASVKPNDGYKLLSLVVNGKEIADGGSFTVTAKTEVKAVMRQLATIVIDKTSQTFVYDGNKKEFVVKTIPAGIGGFTVTYDAVPQDAAGYNKKAYKVTITRDADDVYAAVSQEIEGGLVILAADMKGVAIPTASSGNLESNPNSDLGSYAWENGSVGNDAPIHNAIFTPTSKNFKKSTFSILTGKGTKPAEVTLDWGGLQTRSTSPNVKFTVNGGSLAVLNGSAVLSSGTTLYAGQKIRLVATPDATHAAKVTWSVTNGTLSDQTDTEATLTLAEGSTTVSATFAAKSSPAFPGLDGLGNVIYDGTIYGTGVPAIKSGTVTDNWLITFKQDGVATSTPINAGTYGIYVSRPADNLYSAVIDQKAGSFTIAQKQVTASVTAATSVLKGQSLAQSVLSGTADVDGSFVWIDPTVLMTETGNQKAKFVPANANYKESGELTTKVTVNEATGVTLRTLNVNITNPEKGTVTMTLNGSEVVAGASVTKGDKLIVTYVATAANYKPSATIGGSAYQSGAEYIVPVEGNVEVAVSFTWNNPGTGTDPEPGPSTVDVTGITLEPTSKTLAVNETLALKATVAPADATDTGVSWSSSAPDIVSVDTKGNVKALKAGTATITATTNDGGFTATCKITVSVPTGVEDILSGTPRICTGWFYRSGTRDDYTGSCFRYDRSCDLAG
ncbi:hypothetical protein HMPREF1212_03267 [Parabacteroides sp. HGS0025]|uniref:Ig-like domain-containing protein n=1 Tax=Parabacteroides sp. HGS0025 TaxID=1078087 RepID=UPI00061747DE|nr:Ig-like domain-containing protein [Parabacteroides sp. HGS0025]KKB50107.1 hypothetical protein HMPREF1212_03267 [Parabacteroides sp. HGS0025]